MPSTNMVQLIKKCAMDAFNASKPCNYVIGKVISTSPVKVQISQNVILPANFLLITKTASDYPLITGDKVLMLRKAGGQQYIILDKVVGT